MRVVLAALLVVAVLGVACGGGGCDTRAAEGEEDGSVEGLVVEASESCVTIREAEGESTSYVNAATEQVSVSHLVEHRDTEEPVRLFYRIEEGDRVAYRIDDA